MTYLTVSVRLGGPKIEQAAQAVVGVATATRLSAIHESTYTGNSHVGDGVSRGARHCDENEGDLWSLKE
jgi:hypothetical protein